MKTRNTTTLESLYWQLIECSDESARQGMLHELRSSRPDVVAVLERMLDGASRSFMQLDEDKATNADDVSPKLESGPRGETSVPIRVPKSIGPYKLLEPIGEGGMGLVYLAQQSHPVRRKVAIKIIKPGMDSRQVIARFEAERQALAMMDHSNIAKVLDAGMTEDGRPYFVMELVRGIPITDYCDRAKMSIRDRLDLFRDACRAIQHAHNKGIIHRDIKPSNILVTEQDGRPLVKVIDFGIAKALTDNLTDKTMFTGLFQMVGTPLYMSPEQASLSNVDVDVRSDVYSLGVLLYELLSGTLPIEREEVGGLSFDELRQRICETEPPRLSRRLSTLNDCRDTIADRRGTDAKSIQRLVTGELDWIAMKAIEKDRQRRYQSPRDMADDIERFLSGEAVQACPPSLLYQLQKMTQRRKVALVTTAAVSFALLIGTGLATWQAVRATNAEQRAEANLNAALDAIDRLLASVSDPALAEIPAAQAARRKMMDDAVAFFEKFSEKSGASKQVRQRAAETWGLLAELALSQGDDKDAQKYVTRAISMLERLSAGEKTDDSLYLALAEQKRMAGWIFTQSVEFKKGEHYFREASTMYGQAVEQGMEGSLRSYHRALVGLSYVLGLLDRTDEVDEIWKRFDQFSDMQDLMQDFEMVPAMATRTKRGDKADELWRQAAKLCREKLEGDCNRFDRAYCGHQLRLAAAYFSWTHPKESQGYLADSIPVLQELVRQFPSVRGYHDLLGQAYVLKAEFVQRSGNRSAAKLLLEEIQKQDLLGPDVSTALGLLYQELGENEQALGKYREVLTAKRYHSRVWVEMAKILADTGKFDEALEAVGKAIALNPKHHTFPVRRGGILTAMGRDAEAIVDYTKAIELSRSEGVYNSSDWIYKRRALALFNLERYDEALDDLKLAMELAPASESNLTWISPEAIAACPSEAFRKGVLELVEHAVDHNDWPGIRRARAAIAASLGDFESAAEDFKWIIDRDQTDVISHYRGALVAAAIEDRETYKDLCTKMLARFRKSDSPLALHFTAWTIALQPHAVVDYTEALECARKLLDLQPGNKQYLIGYAALLTRAGRYNEASQQFAAAEAAPEDSNTSDSYLRYFRAIHLTQTGDIAAGENELSLANEATESDLAKTAGWNRRLTLGLLRSEMELLLKERQ